MKLGVREPSAFFFVHPPGTEDYLKIGVFRTPRFALPYLVDHKIMYG